MRSRRYHRAARGFTLIEVSTSLAIVGVLMLGLSSAIVLASHAIPDPTATGEYDRRVIDTLNQMRDDIRDATQIEIKVDGSKTRLNLDLNDTGGLGAPTKVEYNYINASGELYRKADDLDDNLMLTGVKGFSLTAAKSNSKVVALHMIFQVPNSIQQVYEVHALLPQEPVVK